MKIINRQIKLFANVKVNIRYIIKEEEKMVIAISRFKDHEDYKFRKYIGIKPENDNSNDEQLVIKYLNNYCRDFGFKPDWNESVEKRLKMSSLYTSKAKCDPRDEWNEQIGIDVVTEKIALKLVNAFDKRYQLAIRLFKKASIH